MMVALFVCLFVSPHCVFELLLLLLMLFSRSLFHYSSWTPAPLPHITDTIVGADAFQHNVAVQKRTHATDGCFASTRMHK
jgi:hypothetical protein